MTNVPAKKCIVRLEETRSQSMADAAAAAAAMAINIQPVAIESLTWHRYFVA